MTTKKRCSAAAVLIATTMLVSACNPAAKDAGSGQPSAGGDQVFSKTVTGTLKMSGFNPSDEVGKSRSDLATQSLGGVTVSQDTANFDAQKFTAQVASGNVPDLIQADRGVINTLADQKLIMPLDQCYELYGVQPNERYYPAAIKDMTYDGSVYGVPQFYQANLIIANMNVLEPAGVTLDQLDTSKPDDLIAVAKKLTKADGGKLVTEGFEGDIPGSASMWFAVFGGKLYDENGKPALDDPNNVKALTWMKELEDAQGGYATVKSFKDAQDVFGDGNGYVKNQVGAQVWGQWYINVLTNTKDNVKVGGQTIKTLDGQVLGYAGGSAFAIPAAAKNPSAACAWAIQATSPEAWDAAAQARLKTVAEKKSLFTGLFTGSPVADKAIQEKYVKPSGNEGFDQTIQASYEAMSNTFSFGGSPVGQQTSNALGNAVQDALTGQKDPATALADAQKIALQAWGQTNAGKNG